MAIEITPKTKVKMTEQGPAPVEKGAAQPKLETGASLEDILSAAKEYVSKNTEAPAEEAPAAAPAAPKLPEGKSEAEFLAEQAAKAKGANKKKIQKKLAFKLGPSGQRFSDLADSAANFGKAWSKIKGSFSGLVVKDANEQDVDLAGEYHGHVDNIIRQAQRHIEAAGVKEEQGRRTSSITGASDILGRKSGIRVRPEDVATGGRDNLEKYAPLRLDPGEERPPTEEASLGFLRDFADNSFIKSSENFDAMGSADHVEHARNLLAGLTLSIPQMVEQIHKNPQLKAQMVKSGKVGVTPDVARKLLNPALLKLSDHAQGYIDQVGAETPNEQKPKTVYDAFGLDHHLKRLSALANSEETQRSTEQRFGIIKNAYQKKYGDLLAKRIAGKGHVVSVGSSQAAPLPPVKESEFTATAGNFDGNKLAAEPPYGKSSKAEVALDYKVRALQGSLGQYTYILKSYGKDAQKLHETTDISDKALSNWRDAGIFHPKFYFNEDGSYKGHSLDTTKSGKYTGNTGSNIREALVSNSGYVPSPEGFERAITGNEKNVNHIETTAEIERIKGLGSSHRLAGVWNSSLDKAAAISKKGLSGSLKDHISAQNLARRLITAVTGSMEKNGIRTSVEEPTVVRKKPDLYAGGIPTLREYSKLAKLSEPVRQSESFLRTGEHEAEVDPTFGGLKGRDEVMNMRPVFSGGGPSIAITSPSASGFHVPSDAEVSAFNMKKRENRRAAAQAAAARAKASAANRSPVDPFLYGPGPAPVNLSDIRVEPIEEKETVDRQPKPSTPVVARTAEERASELFSDRRGK